MLRLDSSVTFFLIAAICHLGSSSEIGQPYTTEGSESLFHVIKDDIEYIFKLSNSSIYWVAQRTRIPFSRPRVENGTLGDECLPSTDDFPPIFDEGQLRSGAVVVCFLIGIYCFTLLAVVCDSYFLPCVERICEALNLSQDVAAATFMSIATSAPELFVNIIGTFITQSDIGIGTVVGSSLFNTLGVASLGGLAASAPIKIDWWPLTRDVSIYMCAVAILVTMTWDGVIFWYEGLILFAAYFMYFIIMFQNDRISAFVRKTVEKLQLKREEEKKKKSPVVVNQMTTEAIVQIEEPIKKYKEPIVEEEQKEDEPHSFIKMPSGVWKKILYIYIYPIKLLLFCTIPDPKKYPRLFPITFVMCIVWIGSNSYLVSWMITLIGLVFGIPDSVLGLTFLAAGGCLPESFSLIIMSRRGEGSMGVSNSLGANTMNILLSLGMPWFIKTILMGTDSKAFIQIDSGSIEYTILTLILVALILYTALAINKFRLSRKLGCVLLLIYICCIVLAILSETVFFDEEGCSS